jgi:hypothetical protein
LKLFRSQEACANVKAILKQKLDNRAKVRALYELKYIENRFNFRLLTQLLND